MKKIISKIAIILLILLITDRVIAWFFSKTVFSHTLSGESGGSVNYLIQQKKNTAFLIMGSSRAKHHINPSLLTNVYGGNGFNAGINGTGGLIYNSLLLQLLISKNVVPKMVILQVDAYPYFTLEEENIIPEISALYPFIGDSKALNDYIHAHAGFAERIKLLLRTYRFNGKLLNILYNYTKRNTIKNNQGFEGLTGILDTVGLQPIADLNRKHTYSRIKMDALVSIAKTCKENNIRLAVVYPPAYRNMLYLQPGYEMISSLLQKNGVTEIYDFANIDPLPELQSEILWKDATHMNNDGATIFSAMLNNDIRAANAVK